MPFVSHRFLHSSRKTESDIVMTTAGGTSKTIAPMAIGNTVFQSIRMASLSTARRLRRLRLGSLGGSRNHTQYLPRHRVLVQSVYIDRHEHGRESLGNFQLRRNHVEFPRPLRGIAVSLQYSRVQKLRAA